MTYLPTSRSEFNLRIVDFGPIHRAELTLKPFTVFIGKNNTGKSYAALLLRCFYRTLTSDQTLDAIFSSVRYSVEPKSKQDFLVRRAIEFMSGERYVKVLERLFRNELLATFGIESFETLIRSGSDESLVTLECDRATFRATIAGESCHLSFKPLENEISRLVRDSVVYYHGDSGRAIPASSLVYRATRSLLQGELHFLPASRAGISQSYKAMASSLLRKIPYMPLGYNVPTLTSPVAEFISDTLLSEDINYRISSYRSNMLRKVVTRFEKTALKGEVELKKRKKEQIPEIMYKFRGKQLSLLQSSSSVGELAPILISLKYRNFGKGHVLVIEEPEAHLHPAMVEKMADFLGSIRNAGVSLIIPTHSDYLLSSINTRMKEYSIATKLGERISKTSPLINPEQTVAYSFDGENGDTVTKRLRITKEGIPLDEFNEIADKLQEKHASLTAVSLEKA